MQPAISARGVTKSFGRQRVLDSLNVDIPSGVTYCLLGPNGSGKTTFIRAIVRLLHLDGGEMSVLGRPVSEVDKIYSQIGYMTQHKALYPDLTVQENMEFYAGLYGLNRQQREERIEELLRMVDLSRAPRSSGRGALRRHVPEALFGLHPHPRARAAIAGRAHRGHRSPAAPNILGVLQPPRPRRARRCSSPPTSWMRRRNARGWATCGREGWRPRERPEEILTPGRPTARPQALAGRAGEGRGSSSSAGI